MSTTTTVGYGDIRAHADLEKIYACIVMIVGVVSYAYVITSAASSWVDGGYPRSKYRQRMVAVLYFLKVILSRISEHTLFCKNLNLEIPSKEGASKESYEVIIKSY